jgi:hypothetical protein
VPDDFLQTDTTSTPGSVATAKSVDHSAEAFIFAPYLNGRKTGPPNVIAQNRPSTFNGILCGIFSRPYVNSNSGPVENLTCRERPTARQIDATAHNV